VGVFSHFPSNVSIEGLVYAKGGANMMKVVEKHTSKTIKNFNDLLAEDLKDDILTFLRTENLKNNAKGFEFESMLYLLLDKEYFKKVIAILKKRQIFEPHVWAFSVLHLDLEDQDLISDLLYYMNSEKDASILNGITHLKSSLLTLHE
jgi:hypothetical protein